MTFLSPLRYPGGKRKITNFIKLLLHYNDLLDGEYVEPYAGGASVALALLFDEYVRKIHINDLDQGIYAFWYSVLNSTDELCRLISDTPVTIEEWHYQKKIHADSDLSMLELGYSTFFLNRTNRSGIISGGVIGGKEQNGKWKLDARFNKTNLISRIMKIARYRHRIHLYNLDAISFIEDVLPDLGQNTLVYLDPPYYIKGKRLLYTNFYQPEDHASVAKDVHTIQQYWLVSYDNVKEIRDLYDDCRSINYGLNYSAQERYQGAEVMFFCDAMNIPDVCDPAKIKNNSLQSYLQPK